MLILRLGMILPMKNSFPHLRSMDQSYHGISDYLILTTASPKVTFCIRHVRFEFKATRMIRATKSSTKMQYLVYVGPYG